MAVSRLQHRTLNQRVYQRLRGLIISSRISAGEQLDEATLSTEMDVSVRPVERPSPI